MTVKTDATTEVLRMRFGAWLKLQREDIGMTQLDLAVLLDFRQAVMVSQVERGVSALPEYLLGAWADSLRIRRADFANQYTYYCRPFIFEALHGVSPFEKEQVPRSSKTISSRLGKAATAAKFGNVSA